jgi:restriction endonuclease Mrr
MPEKFDFSKTEDQENFENLPQEEKDKIVDEAQEETKLENLEKELSPEEIEKIMENVIDIERYKGLIQHTNISNLEGILA